MATYTYSTTPTSGGTMSHHGANTTWCELEQGKLLYIYKQDAIHKTFAVVVTLNGTSTPSFSTPYEINSWGYTYPYFSAVRVTQSGEAANTYTVLLKMTPLDNVDVSSQWYADRTSSVQAIAIAADNSMTAGAIVSVGARGKVNEDGLESNQDGVGWYFTVQYTQDYLTQGVPHLLKIGVAGTTVSIIGNYGNYGGVYAEWGRHSGTLRKLVDGRILLQAHHNVKIKQTKIISTSGSNSGVANTWPGYAWAENTTGTQIFTTYGSSVFVMSTSTFSRIGSVTTDTGGATIKDAIGIDADTWVTLNFANYGNGTTGSSPMEIRVYRYITVPSGSLAADINPVPVPDPIVGHYAYGTSGGYIQPKPQRILYKMNSTTIGIFGLYNDGGTIRMGFQFIVAASV